MADRASDRITLVDLDACACPTRPSVEQRFPTAATGAPPTPVQRALLATLREAVVDLAGCVEDNVPAGRDKDIALERLEDFLMRANRAVFTGAPRPEPATDAAAPYDR